MAVRLQLKQRSEAGGADNAAEVILDQDAITIGRDKTCDVVLAQQAVSRTHARISRDGTLFFVEDLGSAYGTQINGRGLPKGEKRLLRNGDIIAIAQFDLTFDRIADAPKAAGSDKTQFVARQAVKDVMRGLGSGEGGPYFRVMNGPKEGQRIEVTEAHEITFGRDEDCEVVLKDDLVSRKHCKVRRDWSGTHVEDLQSRNGIKVNRKRTTRKTLKDRDELEIGGIRLLYLDPSEVRESPVVLPEQESGEMTETPDADSPEPEPVPEAAAPPEAEASVEEPGANGAAGAEEPSPGEPAADEDQEAGAEDGAEEPEPGESSQVEAAPSAGIDFGDKRALVPIIVVGVAAALALVLIIAVIAGA